MCIFISVLLEFFLQRVLTKSLVHGALQSLLRRPWQDFVEKMFEIICTTRDSPGTVAQQLPQHNLHSLARLSPKRSGRLAVHGIQPSWDLKAISGSL